MVNRRISNITVYAFFIVPRFSAKPSKEHVQLQGSFHRPSPSNSTWGFDVRQAIAVSSTSWQRFLLRVVTARQSEYTLLLLHAACCLHLRKVLFNVPILETVCPKKKQIMCREAAFVFFGMCNFTLQLRQQLMISKQRETSKIWPIKKGVE